jgi:hypothetical protein
MRNINRKGARAKNGVIEAYPLSEILKSPGIIQSRQPQTIRKIRIKINPDNEHNKDLSSFISIESLHFSIRYKDNKVLNLLFRKLIYHIIKGLKI